MLLACLAVDITGVVVVSHFGLSFGLRSIVFFDRPAVTELTMGVDRRLSARGGAESPGPGCGADVGVAMRARARASECIAVFNYVAVRSTVPLRKPEILSEQPEPPLLFCRCWSRQLRHAGPVWFLCIVTDVTINRRLELRAGYVLRIHNGAGTRY